MSETDWNTLVGSADPGDIDTGATGGVARPNGGGTQLFGMHALTATEGVHGRYVADPDFNPTTKGLAHFSAPIIRLPGSASERAIILFGQLQGTTISGTCYMLGLAEEEPSRLVLRKGQMSDGFPELILDPPGNGVLAIGANAIPEGLWVHVFLGINVQPQDDVWITVKQSDLALHPTSSPNFQPVPGMDNLMPGSGVAFIDDALGLNSGSQPLLAGRVGWGFISRGLGARAGIDEIQVARQV